MRKSDAVSINEWAAYGEAKIAQGLISIGVPRDEASRRAAATIIGVALGGATGAVAAGVPAAVVGGLIGAPVGGIAGGITGGIIGSTMPPFGAFTGPGVGIGIAAGIPLGAAAGAALLGVPAAVAGAVAGGAIGGLLAYTLGAGDPGAHIKQPPLPGQQGKNQQPPSELPHDHGPTVFQVNVPANKARALGLPPVHYSVNVNGDAHASIQLGKQTLQATIPGDVARAPYRALGAAGPQVERTVQHATRQATDTIQKALPGVNVTWGTPPAGAHHVGKHRK
ncbi:hypothetical protein [Gordonia effusa]|nr:hypothetical protein [Gordonia effusa]